VYQDAVAFANLYFNFYRSIVDQRKIRPEDVANMDQTPCPFDIIPKKTIAKKNSKTVTARKPKTSGGNSASVCLTVTATGEKLPAFVIFKGTKKGRVNQRELPALNAINPSVSVFSTQEKNWCDEDLMLQWIELVWKPWVRLRPGRHTALILDDYNVHQTAKVKEALNKLGTFVILLPGGTTNHIQVLDVGINKPFKNALRKASRQWMIDNPPTTKRGRPEIARTLIEAWESPDIVSSVSIQTTFRKIGYEFY
jgi:hypothetical protein